MFRTVSHNLIPVYQNVLLTTDPYSSPKKGTAPTHHQSRQPGSPIQEGIPLKRNLQIGCVKMWRDIEGVERANRMVADWIKKFAKILTLPPQIYQTNLGLIKIIRKISKNQQVKLNKCFLQLQFSKVHSEVNSARLSLNAISYGQIDNLTKGFYFTRSLCAPEDLQMQHISQAPSCIYRLVQYCTWVLQVLEDAQQYSTVKETQSLDQTEELNPEEQSQSEKDIFYKFRVKDFVVEIQISNFCGATVILYQLSKQLALNFRSRRVVQKLKFKSLQQMADKDYSQYLIELIGDIAFQNIFRVYSNYWHQCVGDL